MEQEEYDYHQQYNRKSAENASFNAPINTMGSTIMMLTNPSNELYELELSLRGMALNSRGLPEQVSDPLCNEIGIYRVLGHAKGLVSQNTVMSNLDDKQIAGLIDLKGDTLIKDLMINHRQYGCDSPVIRDTIHTLVIEKSFMCMRRSFNEGEKRFWKSSQQEITTRVEQGPGVGKKNSFINMLGWDQRNK